MNREIIELREVVTKLVPMLVGRGLTVTQRGSDAYVVANPVTRKPERINIPNIPDTADASFIRAIQGFIDHEIGHVLITDWDWVAGYRITPKQMMDKKVQRLRTYHNIIEDTMIEREMAKIFPGSRLNISDLRKHFIQKITIPHVAACKDDRERFNYLLVVAMRALAGHVEFQEYMDDSGGWENTYVKELVAKLPPKMLKELPKLKSTRETLEHAKILDAILHPPIPAPTITAIEPGKGFTTGGDVAAVRGTNFVDINWVKLGGVNARVLNSYSPQHIVIETPAHPVGLVDIEMQTDHGVGQLADAFEYVTPPPPPSPSDDSDKSDQQEPSEGESEDKPEKEADQGDGDGERDHKEPEEPTDEADAEDQDETEDDEGAGPGKAENESEEEAEEETDDAEDKADEKGDEAEPEEAEDEASEPDAEPADPEGDSQSESDEAGTEDDSSAEPDENSEEEADAPEADADASEDAGSDGDEEPEEEQNESDDGSGGQNSSDADDDGDEAGSNDDADDESASDGSAASDADENGSEDDGEAGDPSDEESSTDRLAIQTDDHDAGDFGEGEDNGGPGGVGNGLGKAVFDFEDDAFEKADLSSQIAILIANESVDLLRDGDYNVFTREFDRIEKLVPPEISPEWVPALEEKTRAMVGPMQTAIERMMASQSHVIRVPGFRSGRLNGPSLHRILSGDERLFNRKQEHKSKDTAVTLLIDNSGSMGGAKIVTAMVGAYALSQTLERVNIANEVLGFTTGNHNSRDKDVKEMRKEVDRAYQKGVRYHRITPIIMPIYKEFDERINSEVKKRIAYMANAQRGMVTNIDGESLEYAAIRLMKRREGRKVMLVLSDGQPSGAANAAGHLKQTTEKLEKMGIDLVGIGIQDQSVRRFYKNHIVLSRVEDLPAQVMGELKRILTK